MFAVLSPTALPVPGVLAAGVLKAPPACASALPLPHDRRERLAVAPAAPVAGVWSPDAAMGATAAAWGVPAPAAPEG